MSELKLISPMLDNFDMGDPISHHDGVRCCPAMEKDSDKKYIVKVISIPASQVQLDALLLTGAYSSADAAKVYFKELADNVEKEVSVLGQLAALEGFLPYEDCQTVPMRQDTGYNVYLLGPYRRTLAKHFRREPMTQLGAVNLGLDLCAALAVCRHSGYLYVDLKPENICIVDSNAYRIFDLGFVKMDALKYASLPDRYISQYTAPEITDAFSSLNPTVDIYAAGLILYQAYNNGELPFKDQRAPAESLPAPAYADYEMAEIILKACAPDPADRWQDPVQMGQAIVSYMQRNGVNDSPMIPLTTESTPSGSETALTQAAAAAEVIPPEDAVSAEELPAELPAAEATDILSSLSEVPQEPLSAPQQVDTEGEADPQMEDTASEEAPAAENDGEAEETSVYKTDDYGNLIFLEDALYDETVPDGEASDIEYGEVSDEVSDILSYADELISHPTPPPVIAPEAIEVPIPEALPVEEVSAEEASEEATEETAEDTAEKTCLIPDVSDAAEDASDAPTEEDAAEISSEASAETEDSTEQAPKKPARSWVTVLICLLLLLGLAAAGVYFYQNYYLQPVTIKIDGNDNSLDVYVTADIDESKLTVLCVDTHGNRLPQSVVDGKASFTNLNPGSGYTVSVEVSGFHRLIGDTSTAYSTPVQTNVLQFTALAGPEDGSVVLSFTIDGPDSQQWRILCEAEGEDPRTESFTGHMTTLAGLTVGKEYTFTLESESAAYITGSDKLIWTASTVVRAQELAVTACADNKLTASWSSPEGTAVESWTVRCYNDSGYDVTVKTAETSVEFTELDHTKAYTVEVTAANMTVSERAYVSKNSVTVSDYTADTSDPGKLVLSWNTNLPLTDANWILLYTADGSESYEISCTAENTAVISPAIPGTRYTVTLLTSTGSNVFNSSYEFTTPEAEAFAGYAVSAALMEFSMCKTPEVENWDRYDLKAADYKTAFAVGEKASFLMRLRSVYNVSNDLIVVSYVIRDPSGKIVSIAATESTWVDMWHRSYCELDIPALPAVAGSYTASIYFNGCLAGEQAFTVTSA